MRCCLMPTPDPLPRLGAWRGGASMTCMLTAVDKVNKGKGRVVNQRFAVMCAHYLFDADFCNVASGWEKGVVEKNVQDSRRRIWIEAQKTAVTKPWRRCSIASPATAWRRCWWRWNW